MQKCMMNKNRNFYMQEYFELSFYYKGETIDIEGRNGINIILRRTFEFMFLEHDLRNVGTRKSV